MPIVDLTTNRKTTVTEVLPRLATLYKGAPRPEDGKRPGKDLTYFRVEFTPEYEHLAPLWRRMYGDQPEQFPHVYLTAPDVDTAFPTWMEEWSASALLRRCDGETQVLNYDPATGRSRPVNTPCLRKSGGCNCRRIGRLNLFLPHLCSEAGVIGWVTLSTHSVLDILNIYGYLSWITDGWRRSLMGIEFILGRAPRTVSFFDEEQQRRMKVKKSLVYLAASPDYVQRVILPRVTSGEMAAQPPALEAGSLPALPAGELDDGDVVEGNVEDEPGDPPESTPKNPPPAPPQQKPPAQGKNGGTAGNGQGKPTGNGKPPAPQSQKIDWRTGKGAALIARMRTLKLTQHPADKLAALLEEMGELVDLTMTADLLVRRMKAYKTGELKRPDPPPAPPDAEGHDEPPDIEDGEIVEDTPDEPPAAQMLDGMIPTVAQMRGREGPFTAALVRDFIAEQVAQITGGKPGWMKIVPTDHQKRELAQLFAEASAAKKAKDKEAERHTIIHWLIGKGGISELNLAEWQALMFWLEGETEGQIHPQAYLEYALVLESAKAEDSKDVPW